MFHSGSLQANLSLALHLPDSLVVSAPTAIKPLTGGGVRFALWQRALGQPDSQRHFADSGPAGFVDIDESIQQLDPLAVATAKINLPPSPPPMSMMDQYWLQVEDLPPRSLSRFVALPIPPPSRQVVRVLAVHEDQEEQDFDSISVLVNMGNARAEMLMGYLATGAFRAARRVGESVVDMAKEMLRQKHEDPSSAAIAGYYLLKAGQLKRLDDWTQNLANFFPWMPDGAVIYAWHLMRQDKPNLDQALERLLQAEQRGLPMFTQGLRLLLDGLEFFAQKWPSDTAIAQARDRVQRYTRATNWQALTTSFYGSHPSQPELPLGCRG